MIAAIFTLIGYLIVAGLLYWLVIYVVDTVPVPDPPARFVKIIAMVLLVLLLITVILNVMGADTGINLPKL